MCKLEHRGAKFFILPVLMSKPIQISRLPVARHILTVVELPRSHSLFEVETDFSIKRHDRRLDHNRFIKVRRDFRNNCLTLYFHHFSQEDLRQHL